MASEIFILTSQKKDTTDTNLLKLVNFCGVHYKIVDLSSADELINYLDHHIKNGDPCLMINSKFWSTNFLNRNDSDQLKLFLFSKIPNILVYNIFPGNLQNSAVEDLSRGAIRSVMRPTEKIFNYQITDEFSTVSKHFTGLLFGPIDQNSDCTLNIKRQSIKITNIIMINKLPFFACLRKKNCNLFFLANNKVLDIEAQIAESFDVKKYFSRIIPLMMFIKYACGDSCWHNRQAFASFIIDDPLLRKSYGFLDYQKLFGHMNQNNFFTNIAFIPWNFKRTREEIAKIFRERVNRFGLCVHGCDHTNNEFGINDFSELNIKVGLATEKMVQHEKLTGIKFDNVLVFPQGKFSSTAIKALKCNNYCAAVNSTYLSTNSDKNFRISDLLNVAIMNYYCFPLFIRRYPGELIDFALDLFVGKPAIIVEHHEYFRHGYNRLVNFINSINGLNQDIHWDGLENIIKKSYLEKISADGKNIVKIFSAKCELLNTSDNYTVYEVSKEECGDVPIAGVMVAGKETSYKIEGRFLTLEIEIPPKTAYNIEIIYKQINLPEGTKKSFMENLRIATRRYLSEFRDNFVSKNKFLLSFAKKILQLKH